MSRSDSFLLILGIRNSVARLFAVALVSTLMTVIGCGGRDQASLSKADTEISAISKSKRNQSKTTTVEPSGTLQDQSPARSDTKLPDASACPDEVCLRFMNLLKSGNRLVAERLLTRRAETVTNHGEFPIQPLGGSAAVYQIGEVRFATNKQLLAHVDCRIVEQLDGQPLESQITWLVRKQNEGWRIAGIIFQLSEGQPEDLLSFENPDDVAHLKALVQQQTADASGGDRK